MHYTIFTGSTNKANETHTTINHWSRTDRRPVFLLHSFYGETMNHQSIAQWIVDNPQATFILAEAIAVLDYRRARALAWDCEAMADRHDPEYGDYGDSMDGDHDSAMTSAGWGTDEDYGDNSI